MKTLNEVLKSWETCTACEDRCNECPYTEFDENGKWKSSNCREHAEDTIAYLKEYHELLNNVENEPLEWEELKQMEGKPVWVEFQNYDMWADPEHHTNGSWWIVGEVRKDDIIIAQYLDEAELCEEDLGDVWQAYRKEKK